MEEDKAKILTEVLDNMPVIIIILDFKGNIIYINFKGCEILGYEKSEIENKKKIFDINSNIDRKKFKEIYNKLNKDKIYEQKIQFIKSNNTNISLYARMNIFIQEDNEYVILLAADESQIKSWYLNIEKNLYRYQQIFSKSMEGMCYLNFEKPINIKMDPWKQIKEIYKFGYISDCNEAFAKMYGYNTPDEIIGTKLIEIHNGDSNEINLHAFLDMLNNNYVQLGVETEEVDKNGQKIYFSNNSFGIIKDDHLIGIWNTQIDITHRKKIEKLQNAVYKIAEETHRVKNLDELFKSIHNIVSSLMHGKNFYIALYNNETGMLEFPYFIDEYDDFMPPKKFGKGLTEYVIRTGLPLLATPGRFKSLLSSGEVELIGVDSVDWLGVPLKIEDKTIGVLAVQSYTKGIRYTLEDLNILSYVSDQAAMAIERKMSEDALRLSEEKYRNYIDQSLEGIYLIKYEVPIDTSLPVEEQVRLIINHGVLTECNDLMVKMYGFDSKEELIGKKLIDLYGDDESGKNIEANLQFIKNGYKIQNIETYEINKKGERIWFLNNVVGIIQNGKLVSNWGSQIDITERKKAEAENLYLQNLFSSISKAEEYLIVEENLNDGISNALHEIGNTTKVNRINLFENVTYYETREEYMNKICEWCSEDKYELINNLSYQSIPYKTNLDQWFKQLSSGDEIYGTIDTFDKNIREYLEPQNIKSLLILPIFIDDRFWGFLSFEDCENKRQWSKAEINALKIFTNSIGGIIKQRKSENELREKESEITAIISALPDMIFVFNKSGVYLDVYATDKELLVLPKEKLIGQRFQDIFPKNIVPEIEKKFEKAFKEKKIQFYDYYLDLPVGRRYFETRLNCFDNDKILAIVRDVTERKRVMEELIDAKNKAEEMSRVKTNFLANMSHELRTPLHGILGFAQILNELTEDLYLKEIGNTIYNSGKRLMNTLNQILDLSRIEANKVNINFSKVDAKNLITEVVKLYEQSAKNKNLYLKTKFHSNEVIIITDERILTDILNNLINNAIKFTNEGGVIVESGKMNDFFFINVVDTGIGIPEEKFDLIFQEFRQESEGFSRSFEGTGLGLSLAKKFTELLGGEIKVNSTVSKGSTFTVRFPQLFDIVKGEEEDIELITESMQKETKQEIKKNIPVTKKEKKSLKRILLVENDFASIELIKLFLKEKFKIDIAYSAVEGLEKVNSFEYDIILMDINLGTGMTGTELTNKIRSIKKYKNKPIVAMTAFAMEGDKEEFLKAGCSHYISKPFTKEELLELLENIITS